MKHKTLSIGAAIILLVSGSLVFLILTRNKGADEPADAQPTAAVTVAKIRSQRLDDVSTAFGVVAADPAGVLTIAAPRALIIRRVLVRSGQPVAAGQPLVQVANAASVDLAYRQANNAVAFAKTELARVQRMYAERLATNDQLNAAKKALADAGASAGAQDMQGAARRAETLTAQRAGVVTTVSVAGGDHVAQDAPIVAMAAFGGMVVKIGLEPGNSAFRPGNPVIIKPVNGGVAGRVATHLSVIGRAADQATKTLDATAPLNGAPLPVGAIVQAEVTTGSHLGLVVPKDAVVFDETGTHLFTLSGGKAHRVFVTVHHDYGNDVEVTGPVHASDVVAVSGAAELEDGMAVRVRGS